MRVPAWLAVFCAGAGSARALIFTLPSTTATTGPYTITYQSEATDPAGNLTFWIGHLDGAGGYFDLLPRVLPATTPTKLQVDLIDETGDGQQWQIGAGPATALVDGIFSLSTPLTINLASSSSSAAASSSAASTSAPAPSAPASSSASATPSRAPATTDAAGAPSSSPSPPVGGSSSSKSAPSTGLIVGVIIAALFLLILLILALILLRRRKTRRASDPEMLESASGSALPFSSSKHGHPLPLGPTALRIEPFAPDADADFTNSNSSVGASESRSGASTGRGGGGGGGATGTGTGTRMMSGKAAQARQEYLTNQLRAVQWQLRALEGATATSPSTTSPSATATSPSTTTATSPSAASSANLESGSAIGASAASGASGADLQQARQQNEALQERIRALEGQLNSQWALGLSDEEAPPGYLD